MLYYCALESLKILGGFNLLQDYLYSLNTVPEVLERYIEELNSEGSINSILHSNAILAYKNMIKDKQFLKDARKLFNQTYNLLDRGHPGLHFHIEGRQKSLISTEKKIIRYLDLGESVDLIHDFFAFRIILFGSDSVGLEEHCYKAMEEIIEFAIKNGFTPCDSLPLIESQKTNPKNNFYDSFKYKNYIKDYICFPKNNGYRSIHLVLRDKKGRYFEIQIRTLEMHVHAESSSEANHLKYKEQKYVASSPLMLDREKVSIYGYAYSKDIDNNEDIIDFAGIEEPIIIFQRRKTF